MDAAAEHTNESLTRRWALGAVIFALFMYILDANIVFVVLLPIKSDLRLSDETLQWVVNSYLMSSSVFLLLSGYLGDILGHRHMFLWGTTLFTLSSIGCSLSHSQAPFFLCRALQGIGGAATSTATTSVALNLFTQPSERVQVMSLLGCVVAVSESLALVIGGSLTSALNWRWLFLLNLPIGLASCAIGIVSIPKIQSPTVLRRFDIAGALTMSAALVLLLSALGNTSKVSSTPLGALELFAGAGVLLALFVCIERRTPSPLIPFELMTNRSLAVGGVLAAFLTTVTTSWDFFSALYLQRILHHHPLYVALAYVPGSVVAAVTSLCISGRIVLRLGIRRALICGFGLIAFGTALFSQTRLTGSYLIDVLPGMLLFRFGTGVVSTPLSLVSVRDLPASKFGIATGIEATSSIMGGLIGFSAIATLANARSAELRAVGSTPFAALNGGYHAASILAAATASIAALIAITLLPLDRRTTY